MTAKPGRAIRALCVTAYPDLPEAHCLAGLAERGFEMRVLCAGDAPNLSVLEASPATTASFRIARRLDRRAIARLKREIADFRPDILHLFNNRAVLNGLRAARSAPVRVVAYRGNVGNVNVLDPTAWLRYLHPRIDCIVCVSEAVREYLAGLRLPGWRIPPSKLITIYKGHDLRWYRDPPAERGSLGVARDAFVVGCVANWRPRKGIEVLIRACGLIAREHPLHLVLVGDRMPNARLEKTIAGRLDPANVHFVGHRADAPAVAAAFDVAVLPALKREGLPKTVIEAMAYGVATVATRVAGVPELIEDGISGLIVPPKDARALAEAIARLHSEPALRERLGRAARDRIRTAIRIEDTIEQTAALYERLAAA